MLELEDALGRVLAAVPTPKGEVISLSDADGRVLTHPVHSVIDLPPFDNSSMDGYALRAAETAKASSQAPTPFRLIGKVAAGQNFSGQLASGGCVRLFTGSPLPAGADAVVMQEDIRVDAVGNVLVLEPVKPWENIRFRGEDIKAAELLIEPGERLGAAGLSLLAAAGLRQIEVSRQPIVGLLATGSELREPGSSLAEGQIFESNRIGLAALVRRAGGIPKSFPLVSDTPDETRAALAKALSQCDVVVTSGGVSVGEFDFVKASFEQGGGSLEFWRVAIKPGRPFAFGSQGGKPYFGLPGNPVSALVTFLLLVRPALLRMQGAASLSLPTSPGVLAEPLSNPGRRRHFMRVKAGTDGMVRSAGLQASHVLKSLAAANGLVDVAPETLLPAGSSVRVIQFG